MLLVAQACSLVIFYSLIATNLPRSRHHIYPLSTSYQHLAHSMSPYTSLRQANRWIAQAKDFWNAEGIAEFERDMLRYFIADYIEFHKRNRYNGTRRLVFRPGVTGIGDRFICTLTAYWAAVLSRRVFLVIWDDPFPLQDFLVNASESLDIFYNPLSDAPEYVKHPNTQEKVPDSKYLFNDKASLARYEEVILSDTHTVFLQTNKFAHYFSHAFRNVSLPHNRPKLDIHVALSSYNYKRAVLHHFFRLSDAMLEDLDRVSMKLGLRKRTWSFSWKRIMARRAFTFGKARVPYIGVHARIGKGIKEGHSRFTRISQNMKVAAECLASRAIRISLMSGTPALPIYLATDTPEFRKLFAKVVEELSQGKVNVVSGNWEVAHSTRLKTKIYKNGTLVEATEHRKKMWGTHMDLVLLGHAEHILGLYSSFTRLAFSVGDAESITELRNEICLDAHLWKRE